MILAKSGMSVVVIDRATHPRFAIGESTTPAADYLLHQLATHYEIDQLLPLCRFGSWRESYPQLRCGCKRGFSYIWHGAGTDYLASSTHDYELMVTANATMQVADTQWYRPDVDRFLFELAVQMGVMALESTDLISVRREPKNGRNRWMLDCQSSCGIQTLSADFVVDASGPCSRFMQFQSIVDLTSTLSTDTSAIFTHIENCRPALEWLESRGAFIGEFPYPFDQAAVHHLFHDGWFWQIGFEGNLTSVGFVSRNRRNSSPGHANSHSTTNQSAYQTDSHRKWLKLLADRSVLKSILGDATIAALPGRVVEAGRVQRLSSLAAGEDWAALPFTVGFIDPLHSTGIAHSLSGIKRICDALLSPYQSARSQQVIQYASDIIGEFRFMDQLISGCYDALRDFRLFNCWTMLYFAAATTFERRHRAGEAPSFLLARDHRFQSALHQARILLDQISSKPKLDDQMVESYQREIRDLIVPFNAVGLFQPQHHNMYWHTAAEK